MLSDNDLTKDGTGCLTSYDRDVSIYVFIGFILTVELIVNSMGIYIYPSRVHLQRYRVNP